MAGNDSFVVPADGERIEVDVGNPAAGAEWSYTIPRLGGGGPKMRYLPISVRFTLAAANAVLARNVLLTVTRVVGGVQAQWVPSATQAINTTHFYQWGWGVYPMNSGQFHTDSMPYHPLETECTISSTTLNINGADQYSDIRLLFLRWRTS